MKLQFKGSIIGDVDEFRANRDDARERWIATLVATATEPTGLATAIEAVEQQLHGVGDLALVYRGSVVREMVVASHQDGPRLVTLERLGVGDPAHPTVTLRLTFDATARQGALSSGVRDGHVSVTVESGADGERTRTVKGFFVGHGAKASAQAYRPANVVRESVTESGDRVDFVFTEALSIDEDPTLHSLVEGLTFVTTRRVVDHPVLAEGAPACRQIIGRPFTEITQHGEAIGIDTHATPPAPRWPSDLIERRVEYSLPLTHLPSDRRWVTRWRYQFRFTSERSEGV